MCDVSQVSHEKAEKREGGFLSQFSGIINFSMELYYGDQLCSKYMTKSYPVNKIQAYKYNILMTLQSTVTVIAGDISVYCGKDAYGPSTCTMILCPVLLYM